MPASPALVRAAELGMVLVALIWGANFSVIKIGLSSFPPFIFAGLRFFLASCVLLVLLRLKEGTVRWPQGTGWTIWWLGLVGNTAYQSLFMLGLERTSVGNTALMIATTPVLVALLGALTGIERLTRPIVGGVVLAFAGVLLVMAERGLEFSPSSLTGDLIVFAAAGCWAAYTLGVRAIQTPMSALRITALTLVTGTPGLALLGLREMRGFEWGEVSRSGWAALAYATVLALILAYAVWNNSVRVVGSARTAVYGCGVPAVAMVLAWPMVGERPVPLQILGGALILGGVLVARRGQGA